jgi:hypothetical protein
MDPMRAAAPGDDAAAAEAEAVVDGVSGEIDIVAPPEPFADGGEMPAVSEGAPGAAIGEGDTGQPRRRRRRGRRGRGRGGAPAGTVHGGDASVSVSTPTIPAAIEDEPSVPRGVVAHELMPAATGGRSRRRGNRGGRARHARIGGEPVDPQLISPSNPVPKPRYDED